MNDSHEQPHTSGSPERAAQQLSGAHLAFDLAAETAQVRLERGYREGFRDGETGSLARATRLMQLSERPSIAPVVESMIGPYAVPQQMAPRTVGPQLAL